MEISRSIALAFVVGNLLLAACARDATPDVGKPAPTANDFHPSETPEAQKGRIAARAMLGLAEKPGHSDDPARQAAIDEYEAIAHHMFDVIEKKEPGVFDKLGVEVWSNDGPRFIAAWTGMRKRFQDLKNDPAMLDAVSKDPHFRRESPGVSTKDWNYQPPNDGIPNIGRGPDGWFGDGRTGPGAAADDLRGLAECGGNVACRTANLVAIDNKTKQTDPESRLGAYACTAGYPEGSVGRSVHNAIGFIYMALGTYMEEKIGRVFCDPSSIAYYNDPIESDSSVRMGEVEQRYWDNVRMEDDWSAAGKLGAAFSPSVRDWLQKYPFRYFPDLGGGQVQNDGGRTDCGDKADGWYCLDYAPDVGWMVYCADRHISSGCPCKACVGAAGGTPASCTSQRDVCTSQ